MKYKYKHFQIQIPSVTRCLVKNVDTSTVQNNVKYWFSYQEYKKKRFVISNTWLPSPCLCWQSCACAITEQCAVYYNCIQCTMYIKVQRRAGRGGVSPYYALPPDISLMDWVAELFSWEPCPPSEFSISWTQSENLYSGYSPLCLT